MFINIIAIRIRADINRPIATDSNGISITSLKSNSLSVYLRVGRNRLVERLINDRERPLLQNKTREELFSFVKSTLGDREKYYSQADICIRAFDSPEKLTKRLTNYIMNANL